MYTITRLRSLRPPQSMYCRASGEMSDAAVGVHPDCCAYSLHKHLAWPLQFCFLRQWFYEQVILSLSLWLWLYMSKHESAALPYCNFEVRICMTPSQMYSRVYCGCKMNWTRLIMYRDSCMVSGCLITKVNLITTVSSAWLQQGNHSYQWNNQFVL